MPFLTYDPNAISQLLAQGNPMGQGIGQIGQAMQQFAGFKQQQQEFELRKQLSDIQKDTAKLQQMNEISTAEAEMAYQMMEQKKADPLKFAASYPNWRKEMVEKNPMYAKIIPESMPSDEQLGAIAKRSKTMQAWSQINMQQLEAERKAQEAADKPSTIPTAPAGKETRESVSEILSDIKFKVGNEEGTAEDLLSSDDYNRLISTVSQRAKVGEKGENFADRVRVEAAKMMQGAKETGFWSELFGTEAELPTVTVPTSQQKQSQETKTETKTASPSQIKTYAQSYFGGDEEKAKQYLTKQGYTF